MSLELSSQPECCILTEGAGLPERLYVAYQQGGPPERAGLSWDGKPCPTFAAVATGPVGAKWGAVCTEVIRLGAVLVEWAEQRALRVEASMHNSAALYTPQTLDQLVVRGIRETCPELLGVLSVPAQDQMVDRVGRYRAQVLLGEAVIWVALYVLPMKGGAQ